MAARNLAAQAAAEVSEKLRRWQAKRELIAQLKSPGSQVANDVGLIRDWIIRRMEADAAYFHQRQRELESVAAAEDKPDPREFLRLVLDLVRRAAIHPHRLQAAYQDLFEAVKEWREASARYRAGGSA